MVRLINQNGSEPGQIRPIWGSGSTRRVQSSRATGVRFLNPILSPHGTDPHKTLLGFGFSSFSFFGGFLKNGVVLVWQCIGGFHKGFVFSECLKIRVGRLRKRISLNFNNCVDVSNHLFIPKDTPILCVVMYHSFPLLARQPFASFFLLATALIHKLPTRQSINATTRQKNRWGQMQFPCSFSAVELLTKE